MFSFLDIFFIKRELDSLINKRFEKLFVGENFVIFQFSGENKKYLKFIFGKAIFFTDKEKNKDLFIQKDNFFKELENYLERSFLKDIKIFVGERIIEFIFDFNKQTKILKIGLFGKGEIEFENKKRLGIGLKIKKNIDLNNLSNELKNFNGKVEEFINNYLGFGKYYSNEIKNSLIKEDFNFFNKKTNELSEEEREIIIKKILELMKRENFPYLSEKRPFPIKLETQKIIKEFNTFSEALDYFFKPKSKYEIKIEQLNKAMEKQLKKIEELKKQKEELQRIGDLFFEYYGFFEELKNFLEKNKDNLKEIEQKLKKKGINLNIKEKYIEFDEEILKKISEN